MHSRLTHPEPMLQCGFIANKNRVTRYRNKIRYFMERRVGLKKIWTVFTGIGYLGIIGIVLLLSNEAYWEQASGWEIILPGIMALIGLIGVGGKIFLRLKNL